MIKLFLILIIAGLVYVGMNWERISGQVESGLDTAEEVKSQAMDLKDQAQDQLDDSKDTIKDVMDKAK